jgi:hypothetical protein
LKEIIFLNYWEVFLRKKSGIPDELKREKTYIDFLQDRKLALENTKNSHTYNKLRFVKNRRKCQLKVGDSVYVENGNRLNRKKLNKLKIGPYKILEKFSNSIYRIGM